MLVYVAMVSKWPGGGIISTTEDLARFGSALLADADPALLADSTRAIVFTPRSRLNPIFGYALGWITMRDLDLRRLNMHFGAGSGATSWLGVYPDERVVVAVLSNLGHAGFTYASTMGIGARFIAPPKSAMMLVFAIAFVAFAAATVVVLAIASLVSSRRGDAVRVQPSSPR